MPKILRCFYSLLKLGYTNPRPQFGVASVSTDQGRSFSKIVQHSPAPTCHMAAGSASWLHLVLEDHRYFIKSIDLSAKTHDMTVEAVFASGGHHQDAGARRGRIINTLH